MLVLHAMANEGTARGQVHLADLGLGQKRMGSQRLGLCRYLATISNAIGKDKWKEDDVPITGESSM